jgi:anti-sigma regulatory factor (Ser/Thr protein kinase)
VVAAEHSHPVMVIGADRRSSNHYCPPDDHSPFARVLPPPVGTVETLTFDAGQLRVIRAAVEREARAARLPPSRVDELVLAVNEVASNSIEHGPADTAELVVWTEDGWLCCEVHGGGLITDPLAGRVEPPLFDERGRGLWLANQLCDLVRVHSTPAGTVVRVQVRL